MSLKVFKIPGINNIVIKKDDINDKFFISTTNSFIISVPNLAQLIHYLVLNNYISYKILEGILEEYHSNGI